VQFAVSATGKPATEANAILAKGNRTLFVAIAVLALAGVAASTISLQRHYAKSASQFCDFGERFNCDIVNRSEYSTVMGIPVAGIGIVGYGVLLTLATVYRSRAETPLRLLAAAVAGLGFALYLTYVEGRVLETWCILCLSSLGLIAGITMLASVVKARTSVTSRVPGV
jgi:vitamin-K-epoxide reductase (warfarin-sensitive)